MIDEAVMGRVREIAKVFNRTAVSNLALKASWMSVKAQEYAIRDIGRPVIARNAADTIIAILQVIAILNAEELLEAEITSRLAYIEDTAKLRLSQEKKP